MIVVFAKGLTPKGPNACEQWRTRAGRVKRERRHIATLLIPQEPPPFPLTVTMTRCSPWLLDDDNIHGACKNTRDEIADWLGLPNDRDPRVTWVVEQRKCHRDSKGMEIRIEARAERKVG